jgi:hypothetical protein
MFFGFFLYTLALFEYKHLTTSNGEIFLFFYFAFAETRKSNKPTPPLDGKSKVPPTTITSTNVSNKTKYFKVSPEGTSGASVNSDLAT